MTIPDAFDVVVLDTGARRQLVGSAYDDRRAECAEAAEALGVTSLRALDDNWSEREAARRLAPHLAARVRHVHTENRRVRAFAQALREGDGAAAGAALGESHASLRDDYEVSGPELDTMARLADLTPGILGARLTGGGFAGACVALAERGRPDLDGLLARYRSHHDLTARAVVVRPSAGTSLH